MNNMKKDKNPDKLLNSNKNSNEKLPYKKPKLTHYGSIKKLTLGGGSGVPESITNPDPAFREPT